MAHAKGGGGGSGSGSGYGNNGGGGGGDGFAAFGPIRPVQQVLKQWTLKPTENPVKLDDLKTVVGLSPYQYAFWVSRKKLIEGALSFGSYNKEDPEQCRQQLLLEIFLANAHRADTGVRAAQRPATLLFKAFYTPTKQLEGYLLVCLENPTRGNIFNNAQDLDAKDARDVAEKQQKKEFAERRSYKFGRWLQAIFERDCGAVNLPDLSNPDNEKPKPRQRNFHDARSWERIYAAGKNIYDEYMKAAELYTGRKYTSDTKLAHDLQVGNDHHPLNPDAVFTLRYAFEARASEFRDMDVGNDVTLTPVMLAHYHDYHAMLVDTTIPKDMTLTGPNCYLVNKQYFYYDVFRSLKMPHIRNEIDRTSRQWKDYIVKARENPDPNDTPEKIERRYESLIGADMPAPTTYYEFCERFYPELAAKKKVSLEEFVKFRDAVLQQWLNVFNDTIADTTMQAYFKYYGTITSSETPNFCWYTHLEDPNSSALQSEIHSYLVTLTIGKVATSHFHIIALLTMLGFDSSRNDGGLRTIKIVTGPPGIAKSFATETFKAMAIPGTVQPSSYSTAATETASGDQPAHIKIFDDNEEKSLGVDSTVTTYAGTISSMVNGGRRPPATREFSLLKQLTSDPIFVTQSLIYDKRTGDRINQRSKSHQFGSRLYIGNFSSAELPDAMKSRALVIDLAEVHPEDGRDATDMKTKGRSSEASTRGMQKLGVKYRKTMFLTAMSNFLEGAGLGHSPDMRVSDHMMNRLSRELARMDPHFRKVRTTEKYSIAARAYTVWNAMILTFSVGLGGPDISRKFLFADTFRVAELNVCTLEIAAMMIESDGILEEQSVRRTATAFLNMIEKCDAFILWSEEKYFPARYPKGRNQPYTNAMGEVVAHRNLPPVDVTEAQVGKPPHVYPVKMSSAASKSLTMFQPGQVQSVKPGVVFGPDRRDEKGHMVHACVTVEDDLYRCHNFFHPRMTSNREQCNPSESECMADLAKFLIEECMPEETPDRNSIIGAIARIYGMRIPKKVIPTGSRRVLMFDGLDLLIHHSFFRWYDNLIYNTLCGMYADAPKVSYIRWRPTVGPNGGWLYDKPRRGELGKNATEAKSQLKSFIERKMSDAPKKGPLVNEANHIIMQDSYDATGLDADAKRQQEEAAAYHASASASGSGSYVPDKNLIVRSQSMMIAEQAASQFALHADRPPPMTMPNPDYAPVEHLETMARNGMLDRGDVLMFSSDLVLNTKRMTEETVKRDHLERRCGVPPDFISNHYGMPAQTKRCVFAHYMWQQLGLAASTQLRSLRLHVNEQAAPSAPRPREMLYESLRKDALKERTVEHYHSFVLAVLKSYAALARRFVIYNYHSALTDVLSPGWIKQMLINSNTLMYPNFLTDAYNTPLSDSGTVSRINIDRNRMTDMDSAINHLFLYIRACVDASPSQWEMLRDASSGERARRAADALPRMSERWAAVVHDVSKFFRLEILGLKSRIKEFGMRKPWYEIRVNLTLMEAEHYLWPEKKMRLPDKSIDTIIRHKRLEAEWLDGIFTANFYDPILEHIPGGAFATNAAEERAQLKAFAEIKQNGAAGVGNKGRNKPQVPSVPRVPKPKRHGSDKLIGLALPDGDGDDDDDSNDLPPPSAPAARPSSVNPFKANAPSKPAAVSVSASQPKRHPIIGAAANGMGFVFTAAPPTPVVPSPKKPPQVSGSQFGRKPAPAVSPYAAAQPGARKPPSPRNEPPPSPGMGMSDDGADFDPSLLNDIDIAADVVGAADLHADRKHKPTAPPPPPPSPPKAASPPRQDTIMTVDTALLDQTQVLDQTQAMDVSTTSPPRELDPPDTTVAVSAAPELEPPEATVAASPIRELEPPEATIAASPPREIEPPDATVVTAAMLELEPPEAAPVAVSPPPAPSAEMSVAPLLPLAAAANADSAASFNSGFDIDPDEGLPIDPEDEPAEAPESKAVAYGEDDSEIPATPPKAGDKKKKRKKRRKTKSGYIDDDAALDSDSEAESDEDYDSDGKVSKEDQDFVVDDDVVDEESSSDDEVAAAADAGDAEVKTNTKPKRKRRRDHASLLARQERRNDKLSLKRMKKKLSIEPAEDDFIPVTPPRRRLKRIDDGDADATEAAQPTESAVQPVLSQSATASATAPEPAVVASTPEEDL